MKTIILLAGFHEHETLFLTSGEEHMLKVFQNRAPRTIAEVGGKKWV
jgi:hypothetical protein